MRKLKEIREEVMLRAGRYREVYPEGKSSKDPAPLKVKKVWVDKHRYILCLNVKQARKGALDGQVMVDVLKQQLRITRINMHNQGGVISEPASSLKIEC